jgi:hypothetical protein
VVEQSLIPYECHTVRNHKYRGYDGAQAYEEETHSQAMQNRTREKKKVILSQQRKGK